MNRWEAGKRREETMKTEGERKRRRKGEVGGEEGKGGEREERREETRWVKREGKKAKGVEGVRWREGRAGEARRKDKTSNTTKIHRARKERISIFLSSFIEATVTWTNLRSNRYHSGFATIIRTESSTKFESVDESVIHLLFSTCSYCFYIF